ncbi:MAG: hypothetical protein IJF37_07925, partial [Lachnospiraceae bacterium]|nr:hypothetical protein [Lachnospiraceae bacterium]
YTGRRIKTDSIRRINRAGTARINACGDSRLRGLRSRKPIGFRQWVVHNILLTFRCTSAILKKINLHEQMRKEICVMILFSEVIVA